MALEIGMKNSISITVTDAMCADNLDGQFPKLELPHVFSTPSMINHMEITCGELMNRNIEADQGSVGMEVNVRHLASTPVGGEVTCNVEVAEINGRKVLFCVEAYYGDTKIGEGTHKRAIIKKR